MRHKIRIKFIVLILILMAADVKSHPRKQLVEKLSHSCRYQITCSKSNRKKHGLECKLFHCQNTCPTRC
uniref:WAP domain-containing protein n=1 Tax=Poecilia mexicana TaxID=48701 RepID=A0A3B3X477_9TELE